MSDPREARAAERIAALDTRPTGPVRLTRPVVKYASFAHSIAYLILLTAVAFGWEDVKYVFGWVHGLGWFAMCALVLAGLRLRLVNIRLAVAVAVIGAVGPFVGSAEFLRQDRRTG